VWSLSRVDEERVVDLQDEPGGDDAHVLLPHRLGDGVEVLLVGLVEAVAPNPLGPVEGMNTSATSNGGDRRLEVLDVGLQQLLADVADRPDAVDAAQRADGGRVLLEVLGVVLGKSSNSFCHDGAMRLVFMSGSKPPRRSLT
jgi:hypothetical protein